MLKAMRFHCKINKRTFRSIDDIRKEKDTNKI